MLRLEHVFHTYDNDEVLHDISLKIMPKEFVVISGASGSGKSTLLSIISTLLKPTKGSLSFDGTPVEKITDIDRFRNEQVGFIFQFHYLINHLSVLENVAMVTKHPREEIEALLEELGILELADKFPDEISGGQRQRAAIARALINRPKYIFADEPTGNLDSRNSQIVFDMLRDLDATVIVATHDTSRILENDRVICLEDGALC